MEVERVELGPRRVVGLRDVVEVAALPRFFGRAFSAAAAALGGPRALARAGAPLAVYFGEVGETVDVLAGFEAPDGLEVPPARTASPLLTLPTALDGHHHGSSAQDVVVVALPEGPAVTTVHLGPYDAMTQTYGALEAWLAEQGLEGADVVWEEYLRGPEAEPDPDRWQTRVVRPLRV